VFNAPDKEGPGVDVYDGCNIDYTVDDVSAQNFLSILLGNATTTGGRKLNTGPDDDLFVFYVDHGAPGLVQFPAGDVVHAAELQTTFKTMHDQNRYGRMVVYIEACYAGSMLDGMPNDINIYGVTAVDALTPSLGTYNGWEAVINNTMIGSSLGDLFAVFFMNFVSQGDGSHTLNQLFQSVLDDVQSYAALHYGHEINQRYGDLSMGDLTVGDFFYGDSQADVKLAAPFSTHFVIPRSVASATQLVMDNHQLEYSESAAQPLFHGEEGWRNLLQATDDLQKLLDTQKSTQELYWNIVFYQFLDDHERIRQIWTSQSKPLNPTCEMMVHEALLEHCPKSKVDVTSSYALQFHQVVVNMCNDEYVGWNVYPEYGVMVAKNVCEHMAAIV